MYRFFLAAVDMLPGAVILFPAYCVLNHTYFHNTRKSICYFLFSCYLSAVYVLVGLPNVTYIRPELNLNLIPFVGMIADIKNSFLNVLLFVPLGIMLPLLWRKFRTSKNTVMFGFVTSLFIELLQILTFRTTDVNDLLTNTLGTYLGFLLIKAFFPKQSLSDEYKTHDPVIVLCIVLLIMFFVYPFVSAALWDWII